MEFTWSTVKEVFFAVGSVAGVLALLRPIVESKFQRDLARVERIKGLVFEQSLVDLEYSVYYARQVPDEVFRSFETLFHERHTNQESVRFTGPIAKLLTRELDALLESYSKLHKYIQVLAT
jgi:hypothetical protein